MITQWNIVLTNNKRFAAMSVKEAYSIEASLMITVLPNVHVSSRIVWFNFSAVDGDMVGVTVYVGILNCVLGQ
jgi:hypothetical protein